MSASDITMDQVLRRLQEKTGKEAVETSSGYQASCPAHDDQKASLSISEGDNGNVLIHCHAGCEYKEVIAALGLKAIVTNEVVYDYMDENGSTAFQKIRTAGKKFFQQRFAEDGTVVHGLSRGWYSNEGNGYKRIPGATKKSDQPHPDAVWFDQVKKVLYRLPEISEAIDRGQTIYVVEGEKDADRLAGEGLAATTAPGGAGTWDQSFTKTLTDTSVVILPDNDDPGRKHAEKVASALQGEAASVKIVELPGLEEKGQDISDWLEMGHNVAELEDLCGQTPEYAGAHKGAVILDDVPPAIKRPIDYDQRHAYGVAWVPMDNYGEVTQELVIARDDGLLFTDAPVQGARPLSELDVDVQLQDPLPPGKGWRGKGVKAFQASHRPDPAGVFKQLTDAVLHFMDFRESFGSAQSMAKLVALYILATYFLPAFQVIGYLWPNAEAGSGKTSLLVVISRLAYLGELILSSGSFPTLRDLADYGATLCFDDCEELVNSKQSDPDKRSLLLAGNRAGTYITLKVQVGKQWETRHVHAYCPRAFSATNLPDPVLGSRSIVLPLLRSDDAEKMNRDAADDECWDIDRKQVVDDCHNLAVTHMKQVKACYREAATKARLKGRNLEPWRGILAVALWLEQHAGVTGLFDEIEELSMQYQRERQELDDDDPTRLLIRVIAPKFQEQESKTLIVVPSELATEINQLAKDLDIVGAGEEFTTDRKIGCLCKKLRFQRPKKRHPDHKGWVVERALIDRLIAGYGIIDEPCSENGTDGTNETNGSGTPVEPNAELPCVPIVPTPEEAEPNSADAAGNNLDWEAGS